MSTEKYPNQSQVLTDFYRAIWSKIEAIDYDKPDEYGTSEDHDGWFYRRHGLCWNLSSYCYSVGFDPISARKDLGESFSAADLNESYPFNNGRYSSLYAKERDVGLLFKNEKRLDWIKDHM